MNELIEQLKQARIDEANFKTVSKNMLDAAMETLKADPNYAEAVQLHDEAKQRVANLEEEIRKQAIIQYAESQNKHPHEKVEIKISKSFKFVDPRKVLAWVKTNLADALTYDEKKVKSYATKIGTVDGTEIVEEPKAYIASQL